MLYHVPFLFLVVVNMLNSKHDPKVLKKAFNFDFSHKIFCFYCNQTAQVFAWALWFSKTVALCVVVLFHYAIWNADADGEPGKGHAPARWLLI